MRPLLAHLRLELALLARNGESLLLTLGIPVLLLVFFANVDVLPIDGEPIDFLAPGVLALAVLSTALVNLAIATGFEREYGVLKRLGSTPLGRPRLLAAKTSRRPRRSRSSRSPCSGRWPWPWAGTPTHGVAFVAAVALGTAAFAGLGLCLAGTLQGPRDPRRRQRPLPRAAPALRHGHPRSRSCPAPCASVARAPAQRRALAEAVRGTLTAGADVPGRAWLVLAAWAVAAPLAATRLFRWE